MTQPESRAENTAEHHPASAQSQEYETHEQAVSVLARVWYYQVQSLTKRIRLALLAARIERLWRVTAMTCLSGTTFILQGGGMDYDDLPEDAPGGDDENTGPYADEYGGDVF